MSWIPGWRHPCCSNDVPSPSAHGPGGPPAALPSTLLVVDDDPTNRDLLSRRLRQQGFSVTTAEDGAAALQALAAGPCDAVLLDVMMPGQSGLDVLAHIRRSPATKHLPVIMVTARGDSRDVVEALELGASDYVTKPLDFSVTLARVRAQLARVTAERAALALQRSGDLEHAQQLSAMGQLAGGVAHDVNNLLTAILGHSEFLAEELPPSDPRQRHVTQIRKATASAAALTRQLLALSRRRPPVREPLDLAGQTRAMLRLLRRVIGDRIEVTADLPGGLPAVAGDPGQFDQVVLNLIVNACDAMPAGGHLTVRLAVRGPWVQLDVQDTGCGMDAETQAHIFEPFFTTKAPGHGTGLGLATVRTIAEAFGGDVVVDSAPGRGAAFRVRLPAAQAA